MNQALALKILKNGQNVFLTGSAGTGKTYVLNEFINYLRQNKIPTAITASTGIAATHLGGQTIHSWSGLGVLEELTPADLEKIAKKKVVRQRLEQVKVLIIDEISMISRQTLECIDQILKFFKVSFEPFGGVQVVLSGDFCQLPPVSTERLKSREKFAFMSPLWANSNLKVCYLTDQYRQNNDDLINILNEIRSGEISDSSQDLLMEKLENSRESSEEFSVKLFTHNADVDSINSQKLAELPDHEEMYFADISGTKNLQQMLKKSVLAPELLVLKIGAKVMFVKNNFELGYVNGTLGTVVEIKIDGSPVIEIADGRRIIVKKETWRIANELGQTVAAFSQIPLRLAWAITIHKSQGMTLERAEMDLAKTFEFGQGYVALSRVKSWDGVRLLGANNRAFQMDELVLRADNRFLELSEKAEKEFS